MLIYVLLKYSYLIFVYSKYFEESVCMAVQKVGFCSEWILSHD